MEQFGFKFNPDICYLGRTNFRNQKMKFGIKTDDRRRHMYIIGKTGMGKSTLMENMFVQDMWNGFGCCYIDPHGDAAEKFLSLVPKHRINDVVYFNPSDSEYPIGFNFFDRVDPEYRHLVASGIVGAFHKIWADSWGPRLEYVLRNSIISLLDYPDSTILGVMRILVEKDFRKKVLEKTNDPVVQSFWNDEFSKYSERNIQEVVGPIQNKIGQFLSSSMIRNIVAQPHTALDIREIMDKQKILIVNLSKGRIGEDSSRLLGGMMVTKIQLAAMSRVSIPEKDRKDFFLYVDEFQNFANKSFESILSEARKYRLCLTIGHQYVEQLEDTMQAAILGNVGTVCAFRVGNHDAETLEPEFLPKFTRDDIINLPKWKAYLRLMIDGVASEAFSADMLPPIPVSEDAATVEKVIRVSRERYCMKKDEIEEKIGRFYDLAEYSGDDKKRSGVDKRARRYGDNLEKGALAYDAASEGTPKRTSSTGSKPAARPVQPPVFTKQKSLSLRDAFGGVMPQSETIEEKDIE